MRYKILYHVGQEVSLRTKMESGFLSLGRDSVQISGSSELQIGCSSITAVEMFRLHGLGRMIRLADARQTVFLTVIRFNLFGIFAVVNFFRTGELYKELRTRVTT